MKIKLEELEKVTDAVFSHLKEKGIQDIDIEQDFYWNIPIQDRYNPYQKPVELDLGQMEDDWNELKNIAEGKTEPVSYAMVWLSSLYRAIGEKEIA